MKIQTLGIALFTLFVVSSLEAVRAEENIDYEADELDVADAELDSFDDQFYEVESVHKHKHKLCREKSQHHIKGRCLKSVCIHLCKEDGYKNGKCSKHYSDTIKTCYCYKRCDEPAHPRSPADAPESTPSDSSSSSTTDAPVVAPSAEIPSNNSPADAPVVAPSAETPSSSPIDDVVVAPSAEIPSNNSPADAPVVAPSAETPSSSPIDALVVAPSAETPCSSPIEAPAVAPSAETPSSSPADAPKGASPAHSPSIAAFEAFAYEEADILDF